MVARARWMSEWTAGHGLHHQILDGAFVFEPRANGHDVALGVDEDERGQVADAVALRDVVSLVVDDRVRKSLFLCKRRSTTRLIAGVDAYDHEPLALVLSRDA